jgi:cobalamin-dependent methionine synthase I
MRIRDFFLTAIMIGGALLATSTTATVLENSAKAKVAQSRDAWEAPQLADRSPREKR